MSKCRLTGFTGSSSQNLSFYVWNVLDFPIFADNNIGKAWHLMLMKTFEVSRCKLANLVFHSRITSFLILFEE